jgi:SAM-dependent methyltransferase
MEERSAIQITYRGWVQMEDKKYQSIQRRLMILERMVSDIHDAVAEPKICPVCESKIRLYLPFGAKLRRNAQCPVCLCLERHRFLWLYIKKHALIDAVRELKLLHFAPEKAFYNIFSKLQNIDYYPVDINHLFPGIRDCVDIQKMNYADSTFDLIICSHVLEHIPDDQAAMQELHRVLAPGGVMLFMVPLKRSLAETLENPEYNTPELRLQYYGHSDHLRFYGNNLGELLSRAGFSVEEAECRNYFTNEEITYFGLNPGNTIFMCLK